MRHVGALALACAVSACRCGAAAPESAGTPPLHVAVSAISGPIQIDGELGEDAWHAAFKSRPFEDARKVDRPFTELRAAADAATLYLAVYAADLDLRSDGDRIEVDVGPLHLTLTPAGGTAPQGVLRATDLDGTLDSPRDDDEEWVSEVAIPRRLLPAGPIRVRALRIDAGREGRPHALAWPREGHAELLLPP